MVKSNFEVIDTPKISKKDKITLTFEVESDLEDVSQTYAVASAISNHMKTFQFSGKNFPLFNIGVHYEWNKEQEIKQSKEFLEQQKIKIEQKTEQKKVSVQTEKKVNEIYKKETHNIPVESETEAIMRKMKNGKSTRK